MSKKTFGKVFKIVGIAALAVVGVAAIATVAITGSIGALGSITALGKGLLIGGLLATNVGGGLLAASKAARASRTAMAENLVAQVQPDARAVWCFGRTTAPLQITYAETIDDDRVIQVLSGIAHRIDAFEELYFDDEEITFSGASATGAWSDSVRRHLRYGTEDQIAINVSGATFPSTFRGRGFAYFGLQWLLRGSKLKDSNIPNRITQVVRGCLCYDPRKDSTAGGSGTHRADDQSTWEWTENWALIVLFYLIGWRINSKLVIGRGVDPADIDMASFIAMANVCDQTVDGIARYHIGGAIYIDGDHDRVIGELEATVGGKVMRSGGVFTCWVPHNDLVSTATITEDDILDVSAVQHRPVGKLSDLFNTAAGQFTDPALLYTPETYPEISESAAVAEDGKERFLPFDMPYLNSAARAQRVARQQVRRSRFPESWTLPVSLKYIAVNVFDVITLNCKQTNYTDTLVRVQEKAVSLGQGVIQFSLVIEDAAIYDTSLPLLIGPARALAPGFDAASPIELSGLTVEAIVITGSGGTASDGIKAEWDDAGPLVRETQLEYRKQGDPDWIPAPSGSVDTLAAIIQPLAPETTYEVRARHITVFGVPSAAWQTATTASGQGTRYYDYNGGDVIQNAWFNTRTRFWELTSGWDWTDSFVRDDGKVRNAIQHTPTADEDFEYINGRAGEDRMPGARAHNLGFDTYEGERVSIRVAGEYSTDADGTMWVGVAYYRYDGVLLAEQVNAIPIEAAYVVGDPTSKNLGKLARTFTAPPGAVTGEVFIVLTQHNTGTWTVTGFSHGRKGVAGDDNALDLGDGPADPGATNGATLGSNVYDADGLIVSDSAWRTADGQFLADRLWDFKSSPLGWTGVNATLTSQPQGLEVETTTTDAQLISPAALTLSGAQSNKVAIRVTRTASGGGNLFEFPTLFYKTAGHGFSEDYKANASRKFTVGVPTTFVFDMADLAAGGTDWTNSIITQLRFDPTVDSGDVLEVDWIAVGRISPAVADVVAGNLADTLGFTDFGATDTDADDTFGTLAIADMGLAIGDNISVGLEVLSSSTRRGRLLVRFLASGGSTISDFTSAWSEASTSEYQTVSLQGLTIPATCTQIRFIHQRENSVSGAVGARRLSCNKGSLLTGWSLLRQDVEEAATNGATWGANIGGQPADSALLNALQQWADVGGTGKPADDADVTDYGDDRVANNGLVLGADGYLTYTLGGSPVNIGSVTLGGLGFIGAYDATKNSVSRQSSAPTSPTDGDIWTDTSGTPVLIKVRVAGAWQTAATLNAGALADKDTVNTGDIDTEAATVFASGTIGAMSFDNADGEQLITQLVSGNTGGNPVEILVTLPAIYLNSASNAYITIGSFTKATAGSAIVQVKNYSFLYDPYQDDELTLRLPIPGGVSGLYGYGIRLRSTGGEFQLGEWTFKSLENKK